MFSGHNRPGAVDKTRIGDGRSRKGRLYVHV
jgi:hypothetical protein